MWLITSLRTLTVRLRLWWDRFLTALPDYRQQIQREWSHWGTLRAKREARGFGIDWRHPEEDSSDASPEEGRGSLSSKRLRPNHAIRKV
jgi:hypothetical protein